MNNIEIKKVIEKNNEGKYDLVGTEVNGVFYALKDFIDVKESTYNTVKEADPERYYKIRENASERMVDTIVSDLGITSEELDEEFQNQIDAKVPVYSLWDNYQKTHDIIAPVVHKGSKTKTAALSTLAAGTLAVALGFSGATSESNKNANEVAIEEFASQASSAVVKAKESLENGTLKDNAEYDSEKLKAMTIDELYALLSEEQTNIFKQIDETQYQLNYNAFPSIVLNMDNGSQLYVTSKELTQTYILLHADTYTSEEMVKYFGNGNLLDSSDIQASYMRVVDIMYTYYSRATKPSGISKIFPEKDRQLVEEMEALVCEYNNANNANDKIAIAQKILYKLQYMGNLNIDEELMDFAATTNKGATSYIYSTMIPWLASNREIDTIKYDTNDWDNLYNQLINLNERVTCNDLYTKIEEAVDLYHNKMGCEPCEILENHAKVIDELLYRFDVKNIPANIKDRNVVFGNPEATLAKINSGAFDNYNSSSIADQIIQRVPISKDEVVNNFTPEEIEDAENKADEECQEEIEGFNNDEEERAKGYQAGYNACYEKAFMYAYENGQKISMSTITDQGSDAYKNGYQQGAEQGISIGYQDGYQAYLEKLKVEEENKNQPGEVTEEPVIDITPSPEPGEEVWVPENTNTPVPTPTPNNNVNNNNNNGSSNNNNNTSGSGNINVEDQNGNVIGTEPAPTPNPNEGEEYWDPSEQAADTPVVEESYEAPVSEAPTESENTETSVVTNVEAGYEEIEIYTADDEYVGSIGPVRVR